MSDNNDNVDLVHRETNVDGAAEDAGISEDRITKQDMDGISSDNIIDGDRENKGGVENYAKADDKADEIVESRAGISVE